MGCNCKKGNKINKTFSKLNIPSYEKGGVGKILNIFKRNLWKLLGHIIVVVFMLISIPLVIMIAIFNYFKKGEMLFSLPFSHLKKKHSENVQDNKS